MDNNNNLRIRAKSKEETIDFIKRFLIFTSNQITLKSFNRELNDNGIVYVGFNFDFLKSERAMVKIMVNCLIYYFPSSKNNKYLKKVKDFVINGNVELKLIPERKDKNIDTIEKTHNIFFQQYNNNLRIRLSLFNGQFCYSIIIDNLIILPNMDYNRLIIDFVNRKNKLESKKDFLTSNYNNLYKKNSPTQNP